MSGSSPCFQKLLLNLLSLISLISEVRCLLVTNTFKNSGRRDHSRYASNFHAKKKGEESSSIDKSLKRIAGTTADKGLGDKLNAKGVKASEEKLVDLTTILKSSSADNAKKKSVAMNTESTEFVDNLKVKKIRVPSLSDALKLKLGNDIEEISHTLGGNVDFNDALEDNASPLPLSLPSSSSSSSLLGRKNNDFDIFYYEVSDWTWWDNVSQNGAIGEVSPVTNTAPLKGFVSQAEKEKESVYVFGSFTYGAKLWPSCLAVSLGICRDAAMFKDRVVVDVGCGVGLASLTAAIVQAKEVISCDIAPLTLKLLEKASEELGLTDVIKTRKFDILQHDIPLPPGDVCIFADVLYNEELGRGVARRVAEAKKRGSWTIVGSMRGREGRTAFLSELKLHGVEESFLISDRDDVCVSLTEIGWKSKYVEVLEINRPHEVV